MSAPIAWTEPRTGYSQPFPSHVTASAAVGPAASRDSSFLLRLAWLFALLRSSGEKCGIGLPDACLERMRAMSDAPCSDHAHGTDAIPGLQACWFSASMVPREGPGTPMDPAWFLRWRAAMAACPSLAEPSCAIRSRQIIAQDALHQRPRRFLAKFSGISTRRLVHYLAWFEWTEQESCMSTVV